MTAENYFVNHPVFLKYKRRFDWKKLRKRSFLKKVMINERIIEIPFAIKELAAIPENSKVLDLGCMESTLPLFLAGLSYRVTGFDFREYPYRVPNFEFVQGDILDLPFEDNVFDAVTCVSTIEHVGIGFYDDPKCTDASPDIKGMAEARRVLKPGGLLILSIPFGMPHVNDQQRVYDSSRVDRLLAGYSIIRKKYYRNVIDTDRQNYWKEIDAAEASAVQSVSGTDCVCCISARKL
jgi:SAM-dependent methyltransferase